MYDFLKKNFCAFITTKSSNSYLNFHSNRFLSKHTHSSCEKSNEFEKLSYENSRHTSERIKRGVREYEWVQSLCWFNAVLERINSNEMRKKRKKKLFTIQLRYQIKPSKLFSWVNFWNTIRLDAWRVKKGILRLCLLFLPYHYNFLFFQSLGGALCVYLYNKNPIH